MDAHTWIQHLPKAEHHLHLEGCIPWSMVVDAPGDPLPQQPEWLAEGFRFEDFADFNEAIGIGMRRVLTSGDAYHRVATHHFQQLAQQNVRYVETSISIYKPLSLGISLFDVIQTIMDAAPPQMTVRVFVAFNRERLLSDEQTNDILKTPNLAGIDVHGDEREGSVDYLVEIYAEARRLGLMTKAHAGELREAAYVLEVADKLQPQRIQHGITAANDAQVRATLAEHNIVLDLCPTSNVRLRVVPNLATYPIRPFVSDGVPVTINTDDPAVFGCTLTGELTALYDNGLLTLREIADIQRDSFQRANLPDSTHERLVNEIDNMLDWID